MPTFTHGKDAKFLANGVDLSNYFSSVSHSGSAETAEVTTLGAASKSYIAGLKDSTFSVEGYFDGTTGASDDALATILGTETVWTIIVGGDTLGARGYGAKTIGTSVETGAEIGGAVSVSAEAQSTTGPDAVVVLHPLAARTGNGNGTQVDNGAASSNGAAGFLHVTAKSGTISLVVKVQHSSDGSTWADLITFSTVTAANASERVAVTGTVNRYIRALWTLSGSSPNATFHLSAARL